MSKTNEKRIIATIEEVMNTVLRKIRRTVFFLEIVQFL
jgi:hypothetical protein